MTEAPFDDDLISQADCENLWRRVLAMAVEDALQGKKMGSDTAASRVRLIQQARDYITIPNRDFNEVCSLAGLDPEAVRERVVPMIAAAPSPEELADREASSRLNRPSRARKADKPRVPRPGAPRYTFDGKTMTLNEWSDHLGVRVETLRARQSNGWPIERVLTAADHRMRNAQ